MKEKIFDEVVYEIDKLNIKKSLKKELYYFNEKINNFLNNSDANKIDVIIDNTSKENINILLEYTTNIIEKYGLYNEFIKLRSDIRSLEEIKNSVIIIDKFSIFEDKILDAWDSQERFNNFFTNIKLNNNMVIITCTNKLEKHLEDIPKKLFDPKLCIQLSEKATTKELYNKLVKKYQEKNIDYKLSYQSFRKIINSLEDDYYIKHFDIVDYLYDYSVKKIILDNKQVINSKMFSNLIDNSKDKEKNKRKIQNEEINSLVGLNNIKKELDSIYNYLEFCKKIKIDNNMYLNMFFLGSPGTGKTTVARMYVKKLYELGYIKENKLIEITPNDLMGKYVGHTKDTVRKIFEEAKNGVLFIDEAYLIGEDVKKEIAFMKEALIELLKYLENPKNIVIFAGYQDKMRNLYNDNPGIKSRIYKEIIFEDYKTDELYEILTFDLKEKGLKIDKKSKDKIKKYIVNLKKDINFGNARTIKQLAQKMIINHANKKLIEDNLLIDSSDLPETENNNTLKMGFGIYD